MTDQNCVSSSIVLNGESRPLTGPMTILELLTELKLDARYLAVELNRQVISRQSHALTRLDPGDVVEIVTLVGGG